MPWKKAFTAYIRLANGAGGFIAYGLGLERERGTGSEAEGGPFGGQLDHFLREDGGVAQELYVER